MATTTDTRPLLDRAYDAVIGYSTANRAVAAARAAVKPIPPSVDARSVELLRHAYAAIVAGQPMPDLQAAIAAAIVDVESVQRANRLYLDLAKALTVHRDQLAERGAADALAVVAGELAGVVAAARDIDARLGSVRTADDAVNAGSAASSAFADLKALAHRYDALRKAQLSFIGAGPAAGRALARAGLWSNGLDIDPALIVERDGGAWPPDPWPAPVHPDSARAVWWPTTDPPAFIRWLATGPAEVWCPSPDELADKLAEIDRVIDEALAARRQVRGQAVQYDMSPT